jgi:hypothetical protein
LWNQTAAKKGIAMKEGTNMRLSGFCFHVPAVALLALGTACCLAVRAEEPVVSAEQAIQAASENGTLLYLVFYREPDANAKALLDTVKTTAAQHSGTSWTTVDIADPAQRPVAERFKVTRAPMPMVIAVAANGAVTGAFHKRATPEALAGCIVSPKKAECMAALQQDKLVLLCLQAEPGQPLPAGIEEWAADPHFAGRTLVMTLTMGDSAEAGFLASMQVDPEQSDPVTVFLAPPGVMVGKFPPTATKEDLAAKLADAGKCCDDKNCKHNEQSKKGATAPGKVTR